MLGHGPTIAELVLTVYRTAPRNDLHSFEGHLREFEHSSDKHAIAYAIAAGLFSAFDTPNRSYVFRDGSAIVAHYSTHRVDYQRCAPYTTESFSLSKALPPDWSTRLKAVA